LNWFGFQLGNNRNRLVAANAGGEFRTVSKRNLVSSRAPQAMDMMSNEVVEEEIAESVLDDAVVTGYSSQVNTDEDSSNPKENFKNVSPRTNLNETAFFMPQLKTDQEGNVIIAFDAPEALTRWKFLGFAHTQDLLFSQIQEEMTTQKELMITPNAPRFFREGDQITFTGKVNNLSEKNLQGEATLELYDATTMKAIDQKFKNDKAQLNFDVAAGTKQSARFKKQYVGYGNYAFASACKAKQKFCFW